ncbi:MAG: hypothetical protein QOC98_2449, partial [Frankiaceae bacterium]|nr:hypothetical protein [Frankiaceae bacterium]
MGPPAHPGSHLWVSRRIGGLFLLGFLSYGLGSALADSVLGGAGF